VTIQKSATYKICGARERRTVPIGELIENKRERLKSFSPTARNCSKTHRGLQNEILVCVAEALGYVTGRLMDEAIAKRSTAALFDLFDGQGRRTLRKYAKLY
jgi:hypothetical protein